MLQRRDSVSRIGFKIKIVGLLAIVLATLSIAFSLWTCQQQRDRTEAEILDQSRMLAVEMDAVWEFVSVNQGIINYAADGTYDYKGLHCAVAGKSVAALFGRHSDDIIRFTKLEPRNPSNSPDVFETEALLAFEEGASEYYGFTEWKGKPVFRYVRSMRVTKHCVECHGQPAGELDPLGHPKEGWSIGDSGGGMSIIIPTDLYYDSMQRSVTDNILFFLAIMACLAVTIYFALNKMVTHPLARLGENLALIDRNPSDDVRLEKVESMYGSRETDVLFDRFNSMSSTLTVLYRDLEGQVKDRTEQLAEANRQLEEQRSQLERVNERLKQESQYKSDFLAIVSHELRTPLTSILAFTELLVDHVPAEGARMRRQLDEVEKNGQTLLEMVNNILETARIQAGSEKLNLELVDVADVVSMVESSSRPPCRQARHRPVVVCQPLGTADHERLGKGAPYSHEPGEQRREVHRFGRMGAHRRRIRRRCRRSAHHGAGQRHRHPARQARPGVRALHAGEHVDRAQLRRKRSGALARTRPVRHARRPHGP